MKKRGPVDPEFELVAHAEEVVRASQSLGHDLLVIGAAALAGHHYVRLTNDLDLGGNLPLQDLHKLADALKQKGYRAQVNEPGVDDPLGGVLDISGPFGQIQVVSFYDRLPAVIRDGLDGATLRVADGSPLRIIPLPHLVVLKLYAGGLQSLSDIVEVLSRNEDADLDEIHALCTRYRIGGFERIREELAER